jgi:hypothetical protein
MGRHDFLPLILAPCLCARRIGSRRSGGGRGHGRRATAIVARRLIGIGRRQLADAIERGDRLVVATE